MLRSTFVVCVALIVSACDPPRPMPEARDQPSAQSTTVELFPEAAEVRLYVYPDGTPVGANRSIAPTAVEQTSVGLTAQEMVRLQNLMRVAPPVDPAACGCIYRHVFVFFDVAGAKLGELAICLDCHCAARLAAPAFETELMDNGYAWDEAQIRDILRAHNVPAFDG